MLRRILGVDMDQIGYSNLGLPLESDPDSLDLCPMPKFNSNRPEPSLLCCSLTNPDLESIQKEWLESQNNSAVLGSRAQIAICVVACECSQQNVELFSRTS